MGIKEKKKMNREIRTGHFIIQETIAFKCHCKGRNNIILFFLYLTALGPTSSPHFQALPILDESRGVPHKPAWHPKKIDFCFKDTGQEL